MIDPQAAETADRRAPALPADRVAAAGAMRRRGAAREHLCRARPATLRPRRHGRHGAGHSRAARAGGGPSGCRRRRRPATRRYGARARDNCIEVMTGAVLPAGCDTVVPVEELRSAGRLRRARRAGCASSRGTTCTAAAATAPRARCCSRPAACCTPPEIAVAASAGMARVRVSSQPAHRRDLHRQRAGRARRAGAPHQIRRSNAYARRRAPCASAASSAWRTITCRTMPPQLRERLRLHLETHDVLMLSGGVSMGRFDLVPKVLEELGVRCVLHGVAQRPGKPLWFGTSSAGRCGVCACPAIRCRRWCAWRAT